MTTHIRNSERADLQTIFDQLTGEGMTKNNVDSVSLYESMIRMDAESIRVLVDDSGAIIGCYFLTSGLYAILWRLHVVPSHRGQKLGQLLVEDAKMLAKRKGHSQLQFIVKASNEPLQRWYSSLGAKKGNVWQWMWFE